MDLRRRNDGIVGCVRLWLIGKVLETHLGLESMRQIERQ